MPGHRHESVGHLNRQLTAVLRAVNDRHDDNGVDDAESDDIWADILHLQMLNIHRIVVYVFLI